MRFEVHLAVDSGTKIRKLLHSLNCNVSKDNWFTDMMVSRVEYKLLRLRYIDEQILGVQSVG